MRGEFKFIKINSFKKAAEFQILLTQNWNCKEISNFKTCNNFRWNIIYKLSHVSVNDASEWSGLRQFDLEWGRASASTSTFDISWWQFIQFQVPFIYYVSTFKRGEGVKDAQKCPYVVDQASVLQWTRLVYFSGCGQCTLVDH